MKKLKKVLKKFADPAIMQNICYIMLMLYSKSLTA